MTNEERRVAAKAFWIFAVWRDGQQWVWPPERMLGEAQRDMLEGKMDTIYDLAPEPKGVDRGDK